VSGGKEGDLGGKGHGKFEAINGVTQNKKKTQRFGGKGEGGLGNLPTVYAKLKEDKFFWIKSGEWPERVLGSNENRSSK